MIKLVIALELKRVNFPVFRRSSVEKPMCFAALATQKIFQKKKMEKKESRFISGGFKKVKFFYKKILPDTSIAMEA